MSREPSFFEVYKRLHRAKDNSEEYITLEAARIVEEYERWMTKLQSQNGEGSSSQDSANSIYLDVVGGPNKKGRIYGLGSQATNVVRSSSTPSTSSVDGVSPTEIVAMQAKIQALTDELHQKNIEQDMMRQKMEQEQKKMEQEQNMMRQKMDQWEERFRTFLVGSQFRMPSPAASQPEPSHPAPREEDDHDDEGDDDTNYDDLNL